jgi:hypothetical protein
MNLLASVNFQFSVWLTIIGGILLFNNPEWFFDDPESLYGPLKNNLLIVLVYFVISELACWFLLYSRKSERYEALLMGGIFILVAGGMKFYASVNMLPLADGLPIALAYIGISHLLYFFAKPKTIENSSRGP